MVKKAFICFKPSVFYSSVDMYPLVLDPDNHEVTSSVPWEQPDPDHPGRSGHQLHVLSDMGFSVGCYCFQAEMSRAGAYIGMMYRSVDCMGSESNRCFLGNDFWSNLWNRKGFSAWHKD